MPLSEKNTTSVLSNISRRFSSVNIFPDLAVHARDLIVVQCEIGARLGRVGQVGRHRYLRRIVSRADRARLVRPVGVVEADPHEKRPFARLIEEFRKLLHILRVPLKLLVADGTVVRLEHVAREVAFGFQITRYKPLSRRQRHVQVFGPRRVRVLPRQHADPRRTARRSGQKSVRKA